MLAQLFPCDVKCAEPECIGDSAAAEVEAESALTAAAIESTEIADEEVYDSLKAITEFRLKRHLYRHRGGNLDPI